MADDTPDIVRATTDPLGALRAGLRYGSIGLVLLTVLGLAVWVPVAGKPGLWGVLVGAAVGGGFILVTIDCGAMSVLNNTTSAYSSFTINAGHTSDYWCVVRPGLNSYTLTLSAGAGTFAVTWYDQWV